MNCITNKEVVIAVKKKSGKRKTKHTIERILKHDRQRVVKIIRGYVGGRSS